MKIPDGRNWKRQKRWKMESKNMSKPINVMVTKELIQIETDGRVIRTPIDTGSPRRTFVPSKGRVFNLSNRFDRDLLIPITVEGGREARIVRIHAEIEAYQVAPSLSQMRLALDGFVLGPNFKSTVEAWTGMELIDWRVLQRGGIRPKKFQSVFYLLTRHGFGPRAISRVRQSILPNAYRLFRHRLVGTKTTARGRVEQIQLNIEPWLVEIDGKPGSKLMARVARRAAEQQVSPLATAA